MENVKIYNWSVICQDCGKKVELITNVSDLVDSFETKYSCGYCMKISEKLGTKVNNYVKDIKYIKENGVEIK